MSPKSIVNAVTGVTLAVLLLAVPNAAAQFERGSSAPAIVAKDIRDQTVDFDAMVKLDPDLILQCYFTVPSGEAVGLKLRKLHEQYGRDRIKVVGLGFDDLDRLRTFADDLDLRFPIIHADRALPGFKSQIQAFPVTIFVLPDEKRTIYRVFEGGSRAEASILKDLALTFLQQGDYEVAHAMTRDAIAAGEDEREVRRVRGYVYVEEGKLDEAQNEFREIEAVDGLARVAYERGDYDDALDLSEQAAAKDGYGYVVHGMTNMRLGNYDDAKQALEYAKGKLSDDWQSADALNALGRIRQFEGDPDAALAAYGDAYRIDPWEVQALSNEAAIQHERGNLEAAEATLARATARRDDEFAAAMLEMVRDEMKKASDTERMRLLMDQIDSLSETYKKMKEEGVEPQTDEWSTPPMILAIRRDEGGGPVFFDQAGTETVVQRQLETELLAAPEVNVVERDMLDQLLQELSLGTSDLADPATRLTLGKLLSVRAYGFLEFGQAGPDDKLIYLRLVNSETGRVETQLQANLRNYRSVIDAVDGLASQVIDNYVAKIDLKGRVTEAPAPESVFINLGKDHGVKTGDTFAVIGDGGPVIVNGREIGRRDVRVALLEVTQPFDRDAECKTLERVQDRVIEPNMRVQRIPAP